MKKAETSFYTAINKMIPVTIHREKMHNVYRGGTPDMWYSGSRSDLWVEYKYFPVVQEKNYGLSPLQQQWLQGRYKEGRSVAVIVGLGRKHALILPGLLWSEPQNVVPLVSRQAVTDYIIGVCGV